MENLLESRSQIANLLNKAYTEGFDLWWEKKTKTVNIIAPLWNGVTVCIIKEGSSTIYSIIKDSEVVYSHTLEDKGLLADPQSYVRLIDLADKYVNA